MTSDRSYLTGIYLITSPSGNQYVGSAVNMDRRRREHFRDLKRGEHCNRALQNAWIKYGDRLTFSTLLICARYDLIFYEQRAMDALRPEYNDAPVAGSALGSRRSDAHRKKTSKSLMGHPVSVETRAKIRAALIGRKLLPATVAKLTAAIRRRPKRAPYTLTAEHRANIGIANRGKKRSLESCARYSSARKAWWAMRRKVADGPIIPGL